MESAWCVLGLCEDVGEKQAKRYQRVVSWQGYHEGIDTKIFVFQLSGVKIFIALNGFADDYSTGVYVTKVCFLSILQENAPWLSHTQIWALLHLHHTSVTKSSFTNCANDVSLYTEWGFMIQFMRYYSLALQIFKWSEIRFEYL